MLDRLGTSLKDALQKLSERISYDRAAVEELIKDLSAGTSIGSERTARPAAFHRPKSAALEEYPDGTNDREHDLPSCTRARYASWNDHRGPASTAEDLRPAAGSGKTTTTAKLAGLSRKRSEVGVICGDTFPAGSIPQLSTLCQRSMSPHRPPVRKDALKIVREAPDPGKFRVVIIDTQGRHALKSSLYSDNRYHYAFPCIPRWLVNDAGSRAAANEQAGVFHDAIDIDGVIITKMTGQRREAVHFPRTETKRGSSFIGTGRNHRDLERFDPDGS